MKKVYVNAQWQGGADRSTYDGAEELRKYLPGQDYVILPVSTEEAEMAVMRNGIRDLMFYTGRCSPLTSVCGKNMFDSPISSKEKSSQSPPYALTERPHGSICSDPIVW